jgi:hypothetical protein
MMATTPLFFATADIFKPTNYSEAPAEWFGKIAWKCILPSERSSRQGTPTSRQRRDLDFSVRATHLRQERYYRDDLTVA